MRLRKAALAKQEQLPFRWKTSSAKHYLQSKGNFKIAQR